MGYEEGRGREECLIAVLLRCYCGVIVFFLGREEIAAWDCF